MGGCCGNSKNKSDAYKLKLTSQQSDRQASSKGDIRAYYNIGQSIGTNKFGSLRMATKVQKQNSINMDQFVIRSILKITLSHNIERVQSEFNTMTKLDHPNIIKFYETFEDDTSLYIVMEYCGGGEFIKQIVNKKSMNEEQAAVIMKKLLSACAYMHDKGLAHRNLKPENFLLDSSGEVKIINFGLCKNFNEQDKEDQINMKQSVVQGKPFYQAPEILNKSYGVECDIWSLGVVLYFMLSGRLPFYSTKMNEIVNDIKFNKPTFERKIWKNISKDAQILIVKLLDKSPSTRVTGLQALTSVWILKYSDQNYLQKIRLDNFEVDIVGDATPIDHGTIIGLQAFGDSKKIKKEILKIFVSQINEEDLSKLKAKFYELDKDHNGKISVEELEQAMGRLGLKNSQQDLQKLIQNIHLNKTKNGKKEIFIDYSEFLAASLDSKIYLDKENLWGMFKYFDIKNQNFIEPADLDESFKKTGRQIPNERLNQLFNEMDRNKKGRVDFSDFCRVMLPHFKESEFLKQFEENYSSPRKPILNQKIHL